MFRWAIEIAVVLALVFLCYSKGVSYGEAKQAAYYSELMLKNRDEIISSYELRIQAFEQEQIKMEKELEERDQRLNSLRSTADRLRNQINSRAKVAAAATSQAEQNSDFSRLGSSERVGQMGTILKRATDLVQERDEIAQMYNSLRRVCKLN